MHTPDERKIKGGIDDGVQTTTQAEGPDEHGERDRKVGRTPDQAEGDDDSAEYEDDAEHDLPPGYISRDYAGGDADPEADGVG